MNFEKGYIYHIYNQGNNRQKIFYCRENYLFFLKKVKTYVLPYADLLAWCLMPNHFHLMALVNNVDIFNSADNSKRARLHSSDDSKSSDELKKRSLNNAIAIMLRSYTRAIQKQEGISGTLFRQKTKAECLNCPSGIEPSFYTQNGITLVNIGIPEKQYPTACFHYIHQNPVKAKLVENETDWEFSSALDYAGKRNGKLVNKGLAKKHVCLINSSDDSKSSEE
jgi:putative transposase